MERFEQVKPGEPIEIFANQLSENAKELAAAYRMSQWDVCVAMANACGHILAGSKDMPRDVALIRMDGLRKIMESAYELSTTEGSA